jgi:uncharacterized membrane protein
VARLFSIKPSLTFKGRKFKGIRGFSGKPLHPPLTDITVACYFLVAIFDLVSYCAQELGNYDVAADFFVSATNVLIAGAIVSIPTILTGFWDWLKSTEKGTQAWRTANWHMAIMLTTTAIVFLDLLVRMAFYDENVKFPSVTLLVSSLLIGGFVSFGALYGGTMVYEFAFNVEQDIDYAYTPSEEDRYPGQEEESES